MPPPDTLARVRKLFLRNSKDLVDEFGKVEAAQSFGSEVGDSFSRHLGSPQPRTGASTITTGPAPLTWKSGAIQRIRVALHASLVQEWHTYLNAVYERVAWECLTRKKDISSLSSLRVRLEGLDAEDAPGLRRSICRVARSAFSDKGYEDRIPMLNKVFGWVPDDATRAAQATTRKHVKIRNIFQHNRGVLNEQGAKDLGVPPGSALGLSDDRGNAQQCSIDHTIMLSRCEIQQLTAAMETHSQTYEVLP